MCVLCLVVLLALVGISPGCAHSTHAGSKVLSKPQVVQPSIALWSCLCVTPILVNTAGLDAEPDCQAHAYMQASRG